MEQLTFQDFDLRIEPDPLSSGAYLARVVNSPVGQTGSLIHLPFTLAQVAEFCHTLHDSTALLLPKIQQWGEALFAALFVDVIKDALIRSLERTEQKGTGLRLRLQLADDPLLWFLPWEYLYEPLHRRFLAQSPTTPIVRTIALPHQVSLHLPRLPLKILVVILNPKWQAERKNSEWTHIQATLHEGVRGGTVELTLLATDQFSELQRSLRRTNYHIVHLIGPEAVAATVNEDQVALLLSHQRELCLVLLTSEPIAEPPAMDLLYQAARQLLRQRIPAVVAVQFRQPAITLTFISELYSALLDGYPLDAAMGEARTAVAMHQTGAWGLPLLGMLVADGKLFGQSKPEVEKAANQKNADVRSWPEQEMRWPPLWSSSRPAEELEIEAWLRMAHLNFNPFGPEQAEFDPELSRHRTYPQLFTRSLRDARSTVVFGAPGSGKTACRYLIAQHCQRRTAQTHIFPVICELKSNDLTTQTVEQVHKFVVEQLSYTLIDFFALNPATFLRLENDRKFAVMACLSHTFASAENINAHLATTSSAEEPLLKRLFQAVEQFAPRLEGVTFRSQGWQDIISKARPDGFERTFFICDGVAFSPLNFATDCAFLQALVDYVAAPDLKAVYLKALLPDTFQGHLQLPAHVSTGTLAWSVDALTQLLQLRVFDENGFKMYFEQIFDHDAGATNPARRLAQASQGSPRRLIQLGNLLLAEHVKAEPLGVELTSKVLAEVLRENA